MAARLGRRRAFVVALATLGLLGAFVGGAFASHIFSDVPTGAYYHDDVSWLVARGITSGCGGGKYCPDNAVTRGQIAVFLHKMVNRTRVGHFSCDSYGFQPSNDSQLFTVGSAGATSNGPMSCPIHLPDGATVTKFSVALLDGNANDLGCTMYRQDILSSFNNFTSMAAIASSGATGAQRLSDSSITSPSVDNDYFSYIAFCTYGAFAGNLAVYGMSVEYTYQGVPAP